MKTYNKKWISLAVATLIASSTLGTIYAAKANQSRSGYSLTKDTIANHVTGSELMQMRPLFNNTMTTEHTDASEIRYLIKKGDTLPLIAQTYNVLAADIKLLNHLTSDSINEGEFILIPAQKGAYTKHTVIAGDTVDVIARDYAISVSDLKAYNNLMNDLLFVGQVLNLTNTIAASTPVEAPVHVQQPASEPSKEPETKKPPQPSQKPVKKKDSAGSSTATPSPAGLADGMFPLKKGTYNPLSDTWGDSRKFGGERTHEGTDIMAPIGTPVYSVSDGLVVKYGWNNLGGWRLTVKTKAGYSLYYAHMSKYAKGINNGAAIKKGQLIGYVGSTGYGPEGTSGQFDAHLHFGIYDSNWNAINPYSHLKYWESR